MYSNFEEIINKMITPEENSEEFLKLILTSESNFEGRLLLTENFDYNLNPKGQEDLDFFLNNVRFKASVFLKSIEKLSPEIKQKNQTGIANLRFISFMRFLSTITREKYWEMVRIKKDKNIGNENKKKEFIGYYEKLLGDPDGFDFNPTAPAWYYFRSYTMSPANIESFHSADIKHRLYVAINYDQLMNFTTEFISKLESIQQPYLLKIKSCRPSGRCLENDTLVIYADNEQRVVEYVNILNEIIRSNPEYEQSIHKPSAHLGIIDSRIGYGREFGKSTSYSSVVGKIGLDARCFALKDIPDTASMETKTYSKKEMSKIMERKLSPYDIDTYNYFKKKFWTKFYDIGRQKRYDMDDSICLGKREDATQKN